MINVYYWKDSKVLMDFLKKETPSEISKEDYVKLPVNFKDGNSEEDLFNKLNGDNWLCTKEGQEWISRNLKPHPHTSMSVGDVIDFGDKILVCLSFGWKRVKWR